MSFDVPEGEAGHPVLAIVIETGRFAVGLVDPAGDVLVRDRIAIPAHDVWQGLERLTGRVLAAAPHGTPPPRAVGVVVSGPIDARAGAVSPPYVPAWSSFPVRTRLEDLTEVPVVLDTLAGGFALARLRAIDEMIDTANDTRNETRNDTDIDPGTNIDPGTDAGADTRDRALDAAPPSRSFLELRLGAMVDSACVINGRRLRGAHGNAGSLAHTNVEPDGRPCWCGSTGCLEVYASSTGIEGEIGRPMQHANPSIVDRTGLMLGRAVASLAAIVDVSTVFVSGTVLEVMGPSVLSAMRREVRSRARLPQLAALSVIEAAPPVPPFVAAALAVEEVEREGDLIGPATGG